MSAPLILGAIVVLLAIVIIARTVNIIQQGYVGIVKRVGEFHSVRQPGLTFLVPLVDSMVLVDIRETPRTGDKQDVITRDNVTVSVNGLHNEGLGVGVVVALGFEFGFVLGKFLDDLIGGNRRRLAGDR